MKETPASEPRLGLGVVEGRGGVYGHFTRLYCFLFARSQSALFSLFAQIMRGALSVWSPLLGICDGEGEEGWLWARRAKSTGSLSPPARLFYHAVCACKGTRRLLLVPLVRVWDSRKAVTFGTVVQRSVPRRHIG